MTGKLQNIITIDRIRDASVLTGKVKVFSGLSANRIARSIPVPLADGRREVFIEAKKYEQRVSFPSDQSFNRENAESALAAQLASFLDAALARFFYEFEYYPNLNGAEEAQNVLLKLGVMPPISVVPDFNQTFGLEPHGENKRSAIFAKNAIGLWIREAGLKGFERDKEGRIAEAIGFLDFGAMVLYKKRGLLF